MKNVLIGIDGGGSKTLALLCDEDGKYLGEGRAGPSNICTSVEESWHSIHQAIASAFKNAQLDTRTASLHVAMGLAGIEVAPALESFLKTPHSFKTLLVYSDAHIACVGAHRAADGAVIIVGTGMIAYQIHHQQSIRAGGHGFPHGDQGAAAWLGLQLFSLCFKAIDQEIPWSPCLKHFFAQFQEDLEALSLYANTATPAAYAHYAPLIFEFPKDRYVKSILKEAVTAIESTFKGLCAQSKIYPPALSLIGGLAPHIQAFLSRRLRQQLRPALAPPTEGAIILLRQHLGLEP